LGSHKKIDRFTKIIIAITSSVEKDQSLIQLLDKGWQSR